MSLMEVYLAGIISTDFPWHAEWRRYMEQGLDDDILVTNPLSSKTMLDQESDDNGISAVTRNSAEIILRDNWCVERANLIIANLVLGTSKRSPVGTYFELAWAWRQRTPVLLITEEETANALAYMNAKHPFMEQAVTRLYVYDPKNPDAVLDDVLHDVHTYWMRILTNRLEKR